MKKYYQGTTSGDYPNFNSTSSGLPVYGSPSPSGNSANDIIWVSREEVLEIHCASESPNNNEDVPETDCKQ